MLDDIDHLTAQLGKHALAPVWSLPDAELVDSLQAVHRLQQRAAALSLHLIRQADARGLRTVHGFRSTATWLRSLLRVDPHTARNLVDQAALLDQRPGVDQALSTGAIDAGQAEAVAAAVQALPAEIGADAIAEAEAVLLDHARYLEPAQVRRAGQRILEHVAPEVAEEADRRALHGAEERAHARRGLTLSTPMLGVVRVAGCLTVEDAAVVRAALDPLCVPRGADRREPAQRRADALVDVCRLALRTGELPDSGGEPPQLTVTVALDPLLGKLDPAVPGHGVPGRGPLGHGVLDGGERLSPSAVRRLACDAQVLPVVLGGQGQVVDVGRARRLVTGPLRRALVVRDRGCAFPGCDRPPRWCDAHHIRSWAAGGGTDLDNLVLLCRHHHREIHRGHWTVRIAAGDQRPEFLPPARLDPQRRPRRNIYHRRT